MFSRNHRFQIFRRELEARGVHLRPMWSAKTKPDAEFDNVCMFVTYGPEPAAIKTMIVVDYGANDGFGLWLESQGNAIGNDVEAVLYGLRVNAGAKAV